MEQIKLVVRFSDGRIIKGFTHDFYPNKDRFHLFLEAQPSSGPIEVSVKELKAVFLVRDFFGNSQYYERTRFVGGEEFYGKKVEVTFTDGEVIVGSTLGYGLKRQGFFVSPADPKSNNLRVYAVTSNVKNVRFL